jgi:hypothetical protein
MSSTPEIVQWVPESQGTHEVGTRVPVVLSPSS